MAIGAPKTCHDQTGLRPDTLVAQPKKCLRSITSSPGRPQRLGHMGGTAEAAGISTYHAEIMRAVREEAFELRQDPVKVEAVERAEPPILRVRCLDQRELAAWLQDRRDLPGEQVC